MELNDLVKLRLSRRHGHSKSSLKIHKLLCFHSSRHPDGYLLQAAPRLLLRQGGPPCQGVGDTPGARGDGALSWQPCKARRVSGWLVVFVKSYLVNRGGKSL